MTAEEKIKRIEILMAEVLELGAELLVSNDEPLGRDELATRVSVFTSDITKHLIHRAVAKMRKKWPEHMEKEEEEIEKRDLVNMLSNDPNHRLN